MNEDVIQIGSGDEFSEDEDELDLAAVDADLCQLQKRIEKLIDEKDVLLAKKHKLLDRVKIKKSRQSSREIASQKLKNNIIAPKMEAKLKELAEKHFNITNFRPLQIETMLTTLRNEDCILIMPTGGGKSLTFQLPALACKGVTVVVSPLISLMEDQVSGLQKLGISVGMITGNTPQEEQARFVREMANPDSDLRLIYVTPEKIAKAKRFQTAMEKSYEAGLLSRIVIDEVHCVSQWGHDFRTDYKILGTMKRQYPTTPILGLTATATQRALEDVQQVLQLAHCKILRAGFNRTNLIYEVQQKESTPPLVADQIADMIKGRFAGQSGLIYCFSRNDCERVMSNLSKHNLRVAYYHSALGIEERKRVHHKWLKNEIQCIVATVAFGMGIDKPDVRFIIHHTMSKSIENYYQESGRAGRDGSTAHCVILFTPADFFKITTMCCQDTSGTRKCNEMLGLCLTRGCKRVSLSHHFNEHFEASQCDKMCDGCRSDVEIVKQDINYYATELLNIIDKTEKDLTYNMIMGDWKSKRSEKTKKLSPFYMERIVIQLLYDGVFSEKFKAGMFKPNSYLLEGGLARAVKKGTHRVYLEIPKPHQTQFVTQQLTLPVAPEKSSAPTHTVLTKSKVTNKKRKVAIVYDSGDSD